MKKWILLDSTKTGDNDKIISIILANRKITGKKEIEQFLDPSLKALTAKDIGLKDLELEKAKKRIEKAIAEKESVVVYTDYDADGVCAGAIIWETLFMFGIKVMPYIPHRVDEGYGFSKKGIDCVKKEFNPTLIIAVDHGISGAEFISYAKEKGIDTIIIDHHLLPAVLPEACAIVHTTMLSAGGIAWFFADYLFDEIKNTKINRTDIDLQKISNLELAAITTITDIIPLVGINRAIVKSGLKKINKTRRIGLDALICATGIDKGEIGVYEIGHILGPRINAAGRIEHALDALRLICTKDWIRAQDLVGKLNLINKKRQDLMTESATIAVKMAQVMEEKILVIEHESFNEGIVGLVAGKLVDEYYRPAIVISKGEEYSKASARSVIGFNIVEAIREASEFLESIGGHPMAAGFSIKTKNIGSFKKKIYQIAEDKLSEDDLTRKVKIDLEIDLASVTRSLYDQLIRLAPFGVGNPQPVFLSKGVPVTRISKIGNEGKHLRILFKQGDGKSIWAVGFGMGELFPVNTADLTADIVYTIDENKWNGQTSLQLKLKDVRFHL